MKIGKISVSYCLEGGTYMSGGTKQQFKQFTIQTPEDSLLVLGVLIAKVIVNIEKYKDYHLELRQLLQSVLADKKDIEDILIPAKQYDDINDKLLYRQRELLKYIADQQKSSFSFSEIADLVNKKKYIQKDVSKEVAGLLREFLDVRNWSFHFPQSMLVASKESAQKRIPDELKPFVKIMPQLNPVIVSRVQYYDIMMLISLEKHAKKRIQQFETILEEMKSYYSEIYHTIPHAKMLLEDGSFSDDVFYVDQYHTSRLTDHHGDVAQISMAIQKSKYDGSDERCREWTLYNP